MNNLSSDALERLAHYAAMELYNASLAEASQSSDPSPLEDLAQAVVIHRARAEGMQTAAETLLPPAARQHFQTLIQAALHKEELQYEQDLAGTM